MPLLPGTRLGPYEIIAPIGAGGMGEVYRARDSRLNRDVAIKTSAAKFTDRFEREARAIAALNHSHICQIYDVGPDYLVMELIEGAPLKGPLPLGRVVPLAIQLADALDAAHRKGITHRDLKPGNVLVTKSGIKVLDFGLAKIEGTEPAKLVDETVTAALTQEGQIVGTLQYMAPEQLQGKKVDSRADIFAFGCVVYEMVTGRRAFTGSNTASVIAAILEREAPSLEDMVPVALNRIVQRCLAKDPDDRFQSARDLRASLEWITADVVPDARVASRNPIWPVVAALSILIAAVLGFLHFRESSDEARVVRSVILPPPGTAFQYTSAISAPPALSPDGRRVVFGAKAEDGHSRLYVRSLDSLSARPLDGTDGAGYPFWSPDNRSIGFFANGKLKKTDAAGGPVLTLADASNARGGTWGNDGVIVFAATHAGPLKKVPTAGGNPTEVTNLDPSSSVTSHRWPSFLPDGKHFLYLASRGVAAPDGEIRIGSVDGERDVPAGISIGRSYSQAVYSEGHLLSLQEQTLMARPFDLKRYAVTGEAVPLAEHVAQILNTQRASFAVSSSGALTYQTGGAKAFSLVWFDRIGKRISTVGEPGFLLRMHMSHDGLQAAISITTEGHPDIWTHNLIRNLPSRLTSDPTLDMDAVWSPDDKTLAFASRRKGHLGLYRRSIDGTGTENLLYSDEMNKVPTSWSPNGKFLLYDAYRPLERSSIYALPLEPGGKPFPFVKAIPGAGASSGQFSRDGRWVAYTSNETGRSEVYVAPFPGAGGKQQVSKTGGIYPRWRADGKEVFYLTPGEGKLMVASVRVTANNIEIGAGNALFGGFLTGNGFQYDISPDGQRILAVSLPEQTVPPEPLTLVQNWATGLRKGDR